MKREHLSLLPALLLAACAACAADTGSGHARAADWTPVVAQPEYRPGKGPLVLVDAAHGNWHTIDGRFKAFGRLLEEDGYRVRSSHEKISPQLLAGAGVFVIANAVKGGESSVWVLPTPPALAPEETQALVSWVENGGSLLLIADHMPFPGSVADLATAFGVIFINGYAKKSVHEAGTLRFTRDSGSLAEHIITTGRAQRERISSVKSFTGQAFRSVRPMRPLLLMPDDWQVFLPVDASAQMRDDTPAVSARGLVQGAVLRPGKGRLAVFGEAAMFTAQTRAQGETVVHVGMNDPQAAENAQFALNVMHWLSASLTDE